MFTPERNGTGLIVRHGLSGADDWLQLDTSHNTHPKDEMWVVRDRVCMDAEWGSKVGVYVAHWYGTGPQGQSTMDGQAADTVRFMKGSRGPHVLVGDVNVFEGERDICRQKPNNTSLQILGRRAMWTPGPRCAATLKALPACGIVLGAAHLKARRGSESIMHGRKG
jgi:hypothetical protein